MRNKDAILQRAGIFPPDSSCSCSCHQQGAMFADATNAAAANGRLQNGAALPGQQLYPQLSGNGSTQQPYSQQLSAVGGRCGGCSSCCCQEEQQELHIVRSDPQAAAASSSQGPGQAHHSPSSSISSLPADADLGPERLLVSPKFSRPDVTIQHYSHLNYWLVTIRCAHWTSPCSMFLGQPLCLVTSPALQEPVAPNLSNRFSCRSSHANTRKPAITLLMLKMCAVNCAGARTATSCFLTPCAR
jgi:hypothetical protein